MCTYYFFDESLEITKRIELGDSEEKASRAVLGTSYEELGIEVARSWDLPEISLLDDAPASTAAQLDLTAKGQRIRETLAHFGIGVKVARIQEGPVVTQYALDEIGRAHV